MTISSLDFKARWLTFLEENLEYDITMILSGQRRNNVIDLNFLDLDIFDSSFAENLLHSPIEHLEAGSEALGEIIRERFDLLSQAESYVGTYFSKEYVFRNVLHMSDDEINNIMAQIENEGGGEEDEGDEF